MRASEEVEQQIIERVLEHFRNKKNKILNLSDFVYKNAPKHFDSYLMAKDIAATLKETGKFETEGEGIGEGSIYFVKPIARKKFNERHPVWFAIIMAFIGAGLALGGRLITETAQGRQQHRLDNQQDSLIQDLTDSITNLRNQIRVLERAFDTTTPH